MSADRREIVAIGAAVIVAVGVVVTTERDAATSRNSRSAERAAPPVRSSAARSGGRATVVVFDDGHGAPDRIVVFSDPAGSFLATATTAKDGAASGPMTSGGSITVQYGTSVRHLVTVTAVEPGDRVVVGEAEDEGGVAGVVCRIAARVPSRHPGATRYSLSVGVNEVSVSGPQETATLAVLKRFVVDGKVRVTARATTATGALLAHSISSLEGCDSSDAGAIAMKLPSWSTDLRRFTIEAIGDQADARVRASITLLPPGSDGYELQPREAPVDDDAKLDFFAPRPLGTRARSRVAVEWRVTGDRTMLDERHDDLAESTKVVLSDRMLPRIREARVDDEHSTRPSVRWSFDSPLTSAGADAMIVRLAWPVSREHVWTILAPAVVSPPIVVPELPEGLADWRPDGRPMTVAAGAIDASFWSGYADVKKSGIASLEDPPAGGHVTIRVSSTGDLEL